MTALDLYEAMTAVRKFNAPYFYPVNQDGTPVYVDGDHWGPYGARRSEAQILKWNKLHPAAMFEPVSPDWAKRNRDEMERYFDSADAPANSYDAIEEDEYMRAKGRQNALRRLAAENSKFGLFSSDDVKDVLSADDLTDGLWLVQNMLPKGSTVMLYADGFVGKSYVALSLAAAVQSGTKWHGMDVTQGDVLYLAMEGKYALKPRLTAWAEDAKVKPESSSFQRVGRVINMASEQSVQALCEHVAVSQPALVIVDTHHKAISGLDENTESDMGVVLAAYEQIREAAGPDAVLLFVHHSKKDDPHTYRGSSTLFDDVDMVWKFYLKGGKDDPYRYLECTKNKYDAGQTPKYLMEFVRVGADSVLHMVSEAAVDPVVLAIRSLDGETGTKEEIYNALDVKTWTLKSFGNQLTQRVKSGVLVKNDGTPARWSVAGERKIDVGAKAHAQAKAITKRHFGGA